MANDPIGFDRLVDQIRLNRQEGRQARLDEQNALTRGLQRKVTEGQLATQKTKRQGVEADRQEVIDLQTVIQNNPGSDPDRIALDFYKKRNPTKAKEFGDAIFKRGADIAKMTNNPAKGVEFVNSKTGSSFSYIGKDPETGFEQVDLGDRIAFLDPNNDFATIREIPKGDAPEDKSEKFSQASKIRAEISKASKVFDDTTNAYGRVQAVVKEPSAGGDLALIFNFMKMLDPGSVVRESEFQTAEQARAWVSKTDEGKHPIPAFIKQGIQKLSTGEKLLPEQRTDLTNQSGNIFRELKGRHDQTMQSFVDLAKRFNLEEADIVIKKGTVPEYITTENRTDGSKPEVKFADMSDDEFLEALNAE